MNKRLRSNKVLRILAGLMAGGLMMAGQVAADDAVSISDVSMAEGNSGTVDLSFTVTRSTNGADFTVKWATVNGTAVQPGDYTAGSGTLTFAAGGAMSETVTVSVKGDVLAEADETVFVDLTDLVVTGDVASLLDARGVGTIQNDDANRAPTVATAISERNAPVTVAFSYAFPANTFADADGHPLTYGATLSDGSALPAWLSFNAATRTFSGTPAVADIGRYTVRLTATDNWVPPGSVSTTFVIAVGYPVSVANTSVTEGNSGTSSLVFTVSRTVTDTAFAVNYAFSGTAV